MDLFESTVYTAQHEQASSVNAQSGKLKEPSVLDRHAQIIQPKPVNRVRTAYSHQQASASVITRKFSAVKRLAKDFLGQEHLV